EVHPPWEYKVCRKLSHVLLPALQPHAALLVLLAAAAGAGVVAADARATVLDRLGLHVRLAGAGVLVLRLAVILGGARRGRVRRARLHPGRADEVLVQPLHLEDEVGRLAVDGLP